MKSFLGLVAEKLTERWGENLSRVTIVFPGKRAGLFLSQELSAIASQPIWAPHYVSIDELFMRLSHNSVADPITSITTLYNIYQDLLPKKKEAKKPSTGSGDGEKFCFPTSTTLTNIWLMPTNCFSTQKSSTS